MFLFYSDLTYFEIIKKKLRIIIKTKGRRGGSGKVGKEFYEGYVAALVLYVINYNRQIVENTMSLQQ